MQRFTALMLILSALALARDVHATRAWTEGTNYVPLTPPQPTSVPAGKTEVMEVFSYGCPACNAFQPTMEKLRRSLPKDAQLVLLPAAFNPAEDWPMFQRAYFTAQYLGIAERTHQGIFDAVWKPGGALAISDPVTHRLKNPLPSIEDAARVYARLAGVKPEEFLAMARSFGVDLKMRAADAQITAMQVPGTPCIIVNGKYRIILDSLQGSDELVELVNYLLAKEGARAGAAGSSASGRPATAR
jgi:protein dithiol oxidoreductase (disulfide-forming)